MYYKVVKSNLSFNEAIEAFNNKSIIRYGWWGAVYDPSKVNIKNEKFPLEQIQNNEWHIVIPDNEMNSKLDEIREIMHEMNLNIDSRFYDESQMNIESYWNLFNDQFIIEDVAYNIMKWFYYNKYNK